MKYTFMLLLVALGAAATSAQVAAWTFNGSGGTALSPTTISPNLSVSQITFGPGVGGLGNQGASSGCDVSYTSSAYGSSFDNGDYWQFTLTPNNGYTVDVSSIEFSARRSNTGPANFQIRTSLDGYINTQSSDSGITEPSCGNNSGSITMDPVATAVTFRIYFYGATMGAGTLRIDQLDVYGANNLPINLLSFDSQINYSSIHLLWSTVTELNNDYMAIERSVDGQNFSEIGQVQGAGNSVERIDYSFIDQSPYQGTNYYRLKQVDYDGTSTYHKVIAVEFTGETANTLNIAQNPEAVTVQFHAPNAAGQLVLLDGMGRIIRAQKFEENVPSARISTYDLPKGFYVVQIRQIDGLIKAKSLIK